MLEKIVAATKPKDRDEWIKQLVDCYSTAAQNKEKSVLPKLAAWRAKLVKDTPGSTVAAYVTYREMSADYALKLENGPASGISKLQEEWKESLTKYVQDYPSSEDTPDAMMQLGMVAEFNGKETEAKNWYGQLVKSFEKNPMAAKAAGAIKRLGIEGQEMELSCATMAPNSPSTSSHSRAVSSSSITGPAGTGNTWRTLRSSRR